MRYNTLESSKMPVIEIHTQINAPVKRVFDLCRDMDMHQAAMMAYQEKAIAGKTTGFIGLGETVTWRAKHFGFFQKLTVKITEMNSPDFFADEMVKGTFKRFRHEHSFKEHSEGTLMTDRFDFTSPLGILGKLIDYLILEKYMTRLLVRKNELLKLTAEKKE